MLSFNEILSFRKERSPEFDSRSFLNLKSNELIHPDLKPLLQEALSSVLCTEDVSTYPYFHDTLLLLSDYHSVDIDSILISAGSDDAIKNILDAFSPTPGGVILQDPNYDNYEEYARLKGMTVQKIGFGSSVSNTFELADFEYVLRRSLPAILVLSNPNSPTGFCFSREEILFLASSCEKYGHLFLLDECYQSFSDVNHNGLAQECSSVIILHSFSKAFGLAGARIASIIASKNIASYLSQWQCDSPVSGLALSLLRYMLDNQSKLRHIHKQIKESRNVFYKQVKESIPDFETLRSEGNFVNVKTGSGAEAQSITDLFLKNNIRIRNTSSLTGLSSCIRMTIADRHTMKPVIELLRRMKAKEYSDDPEDFQRLER